MVKEAARIAEVLKEILGKRAVETKVVVGKIVEVVGIVIGKVVEVNGDVNKSGVAAIRVVYVRG